MKVLNHEHLQDEQILWAVIDQNELAGDAQEHLRECPVCQRKIGQFHDELQDFGQKARQAAPPFSRPVTLPKEKQATISHTVGWLPIFGTAAMAGLVVFFYFLGMGTKVPTELASLQSQESLLEDASLMFEISEIVEVPLSEELYAIAGANDSGFAEDLYDITGDNGTGFTEDLYDITGDNGTGFEVDFWDFVVPDIQDDIQSELII
jgi:hypothetical protein